MATPVRVIGRIDLAEPAAQALRAAGYDAVHSTAAPASAALQAPPAGAVDVVIGTSFSDPVLWRHGKRLRPAVPMVAVVPAGREAVGRGGLLDRHGPDAWTTWPATGEALAAAVARAVAAAPRARPWSRADAGRAMWQVALPFAYFLNARFAPAFAGSLMLVGGVGLLLSARSAWSRRWALGGGLAASALGATLVAVQVAHAFGVR